MKKLKFQILIIIFVSCLSSFAQASLINSQVDIEHNFPRFGTVNTASGGGQDILVTTGIEVEDMHFNVYDVDVREDSVFVDFLKADTFATSIYNGLVLSGLDFEDGYILLGVDIDTNLTGWDDSRLTFGDDWAGFNWQGLGVDDSKNFTALFDFGPNPIPIPTTLLLFATGMAGFFFIRKKIVH